MLNSLRSKLIKSVKNKKLNVFGLCLLLTFMFLALTKLSKKYTENITLDINYVNLPKNRVITLDRLPNCQAVVSDYGFSLLVFHFKKHGIKIDFNHDVNVRGSNYIWVPNKNRQQISDQISKSAEIISMQPDTIIFPFETLSAKKVPVVLKAKIDFKPGYDILNGYKISPDSIHILGSFSEISKIDEVETELLILKDLSDTINRFLPLKKLNDHKVKYSEHRIKVLANVVKFTEGTLDVPLTIVNKPLEVSINYFPKTISVSYNVSLNDYNNIKPLDFKVECDFSEIENTNKTFFTAKLVKTPDLVKNVRLEQNRVEFVLMK